MSAKEDIERLLVEKKDAINNLNKIEESLERIDFNIQEALEPLVTEYLKILSFKFRDEHGYDMWFKYPATRVIKLDDSGETIKLYLYDSYDMCDDYMMDIPSSKLFSREWENEAKEEEERLRKLRVEKDKLQEEEDLREYKRLKKKFGGSYT